MRLLLTLLLLALLPACAATQHPAPPHRLVILIQTPAYDALEQIRAGNMGHVAIDIDHHLHDIGSLNGYAFTFTPSRAIRFWNFPDADTAIPFLLNHPDTDGNLDRFTRIDANITPAEAATLEEWWQRMDFHAADPANRLYFWNGLQCASSVADSLREAGLIRVTPSTPADLLNYLQQNLRHTAGSNAGHRAQTRTLQNPRVSAKTKSAVEPPSTLIRMFNAGHRTPLTARAPDGATAPVLWSDSQEFATRTRTLAISPADAVRIAVEFTHHAPGMQPYPNFLLGDFYHLPTDHVLGQASLAGIYINAITGEPLQMPSPQIIRFDLFQGDHITH
jgi:hypothetical protein